MFPVYDPEEFCKGFVLMQPARKDPRPEQYLICCQEDEKALLLLEISYLYITPKLLRDFLKI